MASPDAPPPKGFDVEVGMPTKEKLKKVLVEWNTALPKDIVERDFEKEYLESDEILTIAGPRRAGKTYLCFQMIGDLRSRVPDENILYINFEDERLTPFNGDELTLLLDAFEELFEPKKGQRLYVFIDEIQNISNWGKWCRRIHESRKDVKLVITGSSSKLLSRELSTELRGRALTKIVFPYSFEEFLRAKKIGYGRKNLMYSADRSVLKRAFNEYLMFGGFPRILAEPEEIKKQTLQNYYSAMYYRDIVERFKVGDTALMEDFLKLCIDNFSSRVSISRLEKILKGFGHSPGKGTLATYLSHARDVFLLFPVKMFSFKRTEQLRNPPKIYAIDTGIVNSVRFSFSDDYGRHLENLVFLELMRRKYDVYYFKGEGECDFLVKDGNKIRAAIQVTKTLEGTREREIRGLVEAMKEHKLKEGFILTDDESGEFNVEGSKIYVKPAWVWLLEGEKGASSKTYSLSAFFK